MMWLCEDMTDLFPYKLNNAYTQTRTMHELFSVLISFQLSWECPESVQPLLPTLSHRKTLSLWATQKVQSVLCVVTYHGLTGD